MAGRPRENPQSEEESGWLDYLENRQPFNPSRDI
jgi:hypothetical protein